MFGHTHFWHRDQRKGIHLLNLPPVAYVFKKEAPSGSVDLRLRKSGTYSRCTPWTSHTARTARPSNWPGGRATDRGSRRVSR